MALFKLKMNEIDNYVTQDEYQKFCIELKLSVTEVVEKNNEDLFNLKKDMAVLKEQVGKLRGGAGDDMQDQVHNLQQQVDVNKGLIQ